MLRMGATEQLADAVQQFRTWAAANERTTGEWEADYPEWASFYRAANAVLTSDCDEWDEETKYWLLYAIARENEVGLLARSLAEKQVNLLAVYSLKTRESDAKWQLAEQMRRFRLTPEGEQVLLRYAQDAEEYVRRVALIVLGNLGSVHTEDLAFAAWESGDQHQRMACLHALLHVQSSALPKYLAMAEQDGREYVLGLAKKIRSQSGEYATD
jgi:hypothetical protein